MSAAGPVWPNIQGTWPKPVDPQFDERQLVYPSHPFLQVRAGQASRLAYNEYAGGSWILHVTEPGSTVDALLVPGVLLWEVQDLDGDGVDELVLSPTSGQLPYPRTEVGRWSEPTRSIDLLRSYAEPAIPYFTRFFPAPDRVSRATLGIPSEALDPAYVAALASLGLVPGGATVVVPERDSYLYPVLVTKGGAFGPLSPVPRSMLLLRSATGLVEVPVN